MIKFSDITETRLSVLDITCGLRLINENKNSLTFRISGDRGINKVYITESPSKKDKYDVIFYSNDRVVQLASKVTKHRIDDLIESTCGVILNSVTHG